MDARPLTDDERDRLRGQPTSRFSLLWNIGVGSFGAVGCLGALLILTIGAALRTFGVASETRAFLPATIALTLLAGAVSTALRYKVARRRDLERHAAISADLDGGIAALERHSATAALRAIMEESREHAYFLKVGDGRALFVGYWDADFSPRTDVEIARMPKSGVVLDVTFSGPPLEAESTFVHRQGMNRPSLDIGEFAPVPWEQIRRTYG